MTTERLEREPDAHPRCARLHGRFQLTRNEVFWIEVIRQAASDSDPEPSLDKLRRVRAIFRGTDKSPI